MNAEAARLISQLVMIGVVRALDEANALVRVDVDGLITGWIPFTAGRAGPGAREWSAPDVGEQVVVVCPYGDPAQGVVIGSIYRDKYPAPTSAKTAHRVEYPDGAFVQYDSAGKSYEVDVPAGGSITLRVGGSSLKIEEGQVTLSTPKFVVDATETTVKAIKSNGVNIGSDHKHIGVQTGSGVSGNPQ